MLFRSLIAKDPVLAANVGERPQRQAQKNQTPLHIKVVYFSLIIIWTQSLMNGCVSQALCCQSASWLCMSVKFDSIDQGGLDHSLSVSLSPFLSLCLFLSFSLSVSLSFSLTLPHSLSVSLFLSLGDSLLDTHGIFHQTVGNDCSALPGLGPSSQLSQPLILQQPGMNVGEREREKYRDQCREKHVALKGRRERG